jgi:Response regulator containing CheY-like receiver domain and AraC-type DNA-binding domain
MRGYDENYTRKGDGMRIVIVEDEIAIRDGLEKMISAATEHTVIGACKNAMEGIAFIKENHPDLVITDIRMHGMDGLEMLENLKEQGVEIYSIIISGYAEFEYAKRALSVGAQEYLLKPVSVDALQETLERIENKHIESKFQFVKKPENYAREYFFGTKEEQSEAAKALKNIFKEEMGKIYGIIACYFGNLKKDDIKEMEYRLRSIKRQFRELEFLDAWEERISLRILIFKGQRKEILLFADSFDEMARYGYHKKEREIPLCMGTCETMEEWKDCFETVQKALLSYFTKDNYGLLRTEEFVEESTKELEYPIQAERRILLALETGNYQEMKAGLDEFLEQTISEEHGAEEIRYGAVKLITRMMDVAKEINRKAYESLQEKDYLKGVLTAYTRTEMYEILMKYGDEICDRRMKEGISNYTINRTLEYIRIHYKEGISLEKTAEVLNITPEYLSMLFKREMGMNFSVFLKKFRISHAKRLLKTTDMKIYEVAQECGYSNSNYFTKVFKEVTGISPAEYR